MAAFFGVGSGFSSGFGLGLGTAASPCPRGRRREGRGITERRRGALPTERMRWGRGCPKHHDPQLERGSGTPAGWLSPALGPRAAQLPRDLPDPPPLGVGRRQRGESTAGKRQGGPGFRPDFMAMGQTRCLLAGREARAGRVAPPVIPKQSLTPWARVLLSVSSPTAGRGRRAKQPEPCSPKILGAKGSAPPSRPLILSRGGGCRGRALRIQSPCPWRTRTQSSNL